MQKKHIALVLGCCVTAIALWYSLRGINWGDFRSALGEVDWIWLLPGLATFYYSMYLRAPRWGLLFLPHHRLSGPAMFRPLMIGFAFNSILPARVGEFVRAFYVGKRMNTGVSTALATVVAERIFDGVMLLSFLTLAFAILPPIAADMTFTEGKWKLSGAMINDGIQKITIASAVLVIGVIIFMIPWTQFTLIRIIRNVPGLPPRVRLVGEHLLGQFARGFHALKQPKALALILFYSVALWALVGVSNMVIAWGFGLAMNFWQAMALVTLIGIFILIPAAPGYWGLFEAGTIFSLMLLGITEDRALALAYALTIHLVQYVPIVVVGLWFAAQAQIKADVIEAEAAVDQPVSLTEK